MGALLLSACAEPEPAGAPPLKLDCALGFEALSAQIVTAPGMKPAVKERGEPFRYYNAEGGQSSYMLTEPGAPGHPAILKQQVTPTGITNSGCAYGDEKGYAELVAYLEALAKARAK
ncbi:hypothetical protein [Phenylobacterium sp.]|uniref:hypothetical protein n=1 Tax=Phenylobacterium sp. TaxID=1871053 RepID=UPI0030F3E3E2